MYLLCSKDDGLTCVRLCVTVLYETEDSMPSHIVSIIQIHLDFIVWKGIRIPTMVDIEIASSFVLENE